MVRGFIYSERCDSKTKTTFECSKRKSEKCTASIVLWKDGSDPTYNENHNHTPFEEYEIEKKFVRVSLFIFICLSRHH